MKELPPQPESSQWYLNEELIQDQIGRVWAEENAPPKVDGFCDFVLISCHADYRIFKVWAVQSRQYLAIKVLPDSCLTDAKALLRLQKEIHICKRLQYPGIVNFIGEATDQSRRPVAIWNWMPLGSLQDYLVRGRCPDWIADTVSAVHFLQRLCAAVSYAHTEGELHGAINPAHILFDAQGTAHLYGFGTFGFKAESNLRVNDDLQALGKVLQKVLQCLGANSPPEFGIRRPEAELQRIVSACMSSGPVAQYPDVATLGKNLANWLQGATV